MAQAAWKSLGRGLVPGGLAALKAVLTPVCASEEPTVEVPVSWPHRRQGSRTWPHLPAMPGRWQTEGGGGISGAVIWLDPVLAVWPWAGNFTLWASLFLICKRAKIAYLKGYYYGGEFTLSIIQWNVKVMDVFFWIWKMNAELWELLLSGIK